MVQTSKVFKAAPFSNTYLKISFKFGDRQVYIQRDPLHIFKKKQTFFDSQNIKFLKILIEKKLECNKVMYERKSMIIAMSNQ